MWRLQSYKSSNSCNPYSMVDQYVVLRIKLLRLNQNYKNCNGQKFINLYEENFHPHLLN